MSSGRNHDKATYYTAGAILAFSPMLSAFGINSIYGLIVAASELIGGYYLSPDMDGTSVPSRPFRRWGIMGIYWMPYRALVPHRHWISHFVVVSSAIRLLYVLFPVELISLFVFDFSVVSFLIKSRSDVLLAIFTGVEISCILHLIMDYWIVFKD